jgi:hypothetical protein
MQASCSTRTEKFGTEAKLPAILLNIALSGMSPVADITQRTYQLAPRTVFHEIYAADRI